MTLREMELKDTVEMMKSSDYKERFFTEYLQTKIRYEKLKKFNTRIEAADMMKFEENQIEMPKHDCPLHLLREQQNVMGQYLHLLELRAEIEGIDLDKRYELEVTDWCGVNVGNVATTPIRADILTLNQLSTDNTQ